MTRHPIIIGVGQSINRSVEFENAPSPIGLAKEAIQNCVSDCGCLNILSYVDSLSVVNILSWQYTDPVGLLCEMLDIRPRIKEYTLIGGNTPQWLVNRAADKITSGEIEIALLVGAEAMYTVTKAVRAGYTIPWPVTASGSANQQLSASLGDTLSDVYHGDSQADHSRSPLTIIGDDRSGTSAHEILHGATLPIQIYPLFENALRGARGLSIEKHKMFLSEFCAGFSEIASQNQFAWFPKARTSSEIGEVSDINRIIGFPYTKFMNSVIDVNQAAGVILTSDEMAEKLSIPKHKRVYLHGGAEAIDKWFVSDRVDYSLSPAIQEISRATLEMTGIDLDQVSFFDLYSCFPCAPIVAAKSMGLDLDSLPPLTITGGLPYFGGAGNNYTMHAIAEAVERIRQHPNQYGYISALGWYITKHAAGIYSGIEPTKLWNRQGQYYIQQKLDAMESPGLALDPEGPAVVETYTVMHDRQGNPDYAIVVARLQDGRRCWANTEKDMALFVAMESEEFIGKPGFVSYGGNNPNIIKF
ncbi:MAG: acetyl-CoA acetyltransferase [Chloroflexota bacterium]|nr:acetyl-CoA acetyltransferase [Chloroflexota bacterium]